MFRSKTPPGYFPTTQDQPCTVLMPQLLQATHVATTESRVDESEPGVSGNQLLLVFVISVQIHSS